MKDMEKNATWYANCYAKWPANDAALKSTVAKAYIAGASEAEDKKWEQRRYEIAKECLSSTIDSAYREYSEIVIKSKVQFSIQFADELIKQLKGE